jgi:hypothetical protein
VFGNRSDDHPEEDGTWQVPFNQPYKGTTFFSRGHYGSTVFDPPPSSPVRLELNICDPCLEERAERIIHVREVSDIIRYRVTQWRADGESQ